MTCEGDRRFRTLFVYMNAKQMSNNSFYTHQSKRSIFRPNPSARSYRTHHRGVLVALTGHATSVEGVMGRYYVDIVSSGLR